MKFAGRGVAGHYRNSTITTSGSRSQIVRSYDIEGQGNFNRPNIAEEADLLDHIRSATTTYGSRAIPPRSNSGAFEGICNGTSADPHPAMCLSSYFIHTNDRMEGCGTRRCKDIGQFDREPCVHPRFPKSTSRRSYRGKKDQFDSMWAELHQAPSLDIDVGMA